MSVMKKQFMKVRQIADQTIFRSDKTEVLNKELEQTEKRLDGLKQPCQVLYKKMRACHQGSQEPLDKRKKHMPEIQLSNSMTELLDTHLEGNTLLWQVLKNCSELQELLGETLLAAHVQAEKDVILTLHDFAEKEIHNVGKLRKQLFRLSQEMDSARFRYESSVKNMQQSSGPAQMKVEGFREEVEELSMKVEQARDTYAAEIYGLVSRESSICQSFMQWYQMQTAYHEKCLQILNSGTPALQKLIDHSNHHPLYGYSLEDHLQRTGREIALVLEACVLCLLETSINEEGLFRIAGSASKVKKLKNALDAGVSNMYEYVTDPHAVAGALKSYLRALPEPLMTYSAYDDWIQADRISESDARLQRLWQVLNGIPKANYNNLRYLIKFLHCLCKSSEYNKMSSQNLSIVMAPNLLWSPASQQSDHIALNMCAANAHSSIVETLISYCDWFFPDEVEFRQTLGPLPSPKGTLTPSLVDGGSVGNLSFKGIINTAFEGANGESEDSCSGSGQSPRVIHRPGKKPAPPVPHSQSSETPVETRPNPTESPPNQICEHPMSRSATLDRPGKPKRAPTRKSHDNLASLLALEDAQQSNASSQHPRTKLESETTVVHGTGKESSNSSLTSPSQSSVKKETTGQSSTYQGTVTNHLSNAKERSIERANWFMGDNNLLIRGEQNSQPAAFRTQSTLRKNETGPPKETQGASHTEHDVEKTRSENSSRQNVITKNKSSETSEKHNQGTIVQRSLSLLESSSKNGSSGAGQSGPAQTYQDANAGQPNVPFAQAALATKGKEPSLDGQPQVYASENSPGMPEPLYENISSRIIKDTCSVHQTPSDRGTVTQTGILEKEDQKVVHADRASLNRVELEANKPHTTVVRSQEEPDREVKPQVPHKPASLSAESRNPQESGSLVQSAENNQMGEEQGIKSSAGGVDKWQFLTSGQRTDKIPERLPKVATPDMVEGEGKKAPPSPSTRVKPPRPQPPAPPVKPKPNNDAEDTRL